MGTSTEWQLAQNAAEQYEKVLVPSILGPAAEALVEWVSWHPGQTVVDIGCGTGVAARSAARKVGRSGRVIGVDVNPGMIGVARSLPAVDGPFIEWHEGSAYQLPLDDGTCDVALCAQTLQFLADRSAAVAESLRVLVSGGRLAVSVWSPLAGSPYFHALVDAVTTHLGADTVAGLRAAFNLSDPDEIRSLLANAGFKDVEVSAHRIEMDLPDPREFVPAHVSAIPMSAGFAAAPPDARAAVVRDVARAMGLYVKDAGVCVPFTMYVATAIA